MKLLGLSFLCAIAYAQGPYGACKDMPNCTLKPMFLGNLGTSVTDFNSAYTPGATRLLTAVSLTVQQTAATAQCSFQMKVSGSYYQIQTNLAATAAGGVVLLSPVFAAQSGESFAVSCTTTGVNAWLICVEYDLTSSSLFTRYTFPVNATNLLYTVSPGRAAIYYGKVVTIGPTGPNMCGYSNQTSPSSAQAINGYAVPSGNSVGTANQFYTNGAVAAGVVTVLATLLSLDQNDFIRVDNPSVMRPAGQIAWCTMYEVPR